MDTKHAVDYFLNKYLGTGDDELKNYLVRISHVYSREKKEILFHEGDKGDTVYFLITGTIKLFRTNAEGKEAVIHFVYPGDIFAEILFFMEYTYPVSAMCLENSVMLGINAAGFLQIIKDHPEFSLRLIGALTRRIKYFVNMIENLTLSDVRSRFILYLRTIEEKRGKSFRLPIPKGEVAALMGTTPETFSRLLKVLCEEQLIEVSGRNIKILKELESD